MHLNVVICKISYVRCTWMRPDPDSLWLIQINARNWLILWILGDRLNNNDVHVNLAVHTQQRTAHGCSWKSRDDPDHFTFAFYSAELQVQKKRWCGQSDRAVEYRHYNTTKRFLEIDVFTLWSHKWFLTLKSVVWSIHESSFDKL